MVFLLDSAGVGWKVEPFLHLEAIAATACVVADRFTSVKQLAEGGHVRQLVTGVARSIPSVGWLVTRARWASFRRTKPLSKWGFERGTPIDRWYIERFLEKHQERVQGRALEVLEDLYASRFGAAEVDVVDIDQGNPLATIRGDLCRSGTLPAAAFDTILLTQTLQFLADPRKALENLVAALKPGGTMLVTAPVLSRVADQTDRWRWTPRGLEDITVGLGCAASVDGQGNLLTSRGFLMGLAMEELPAAALCVEDRAFPVIVTARLDKLVDPLSTET